MQPEEIVNRLIESGEVKGRMLLEMPQHFPGAVVYQADAKFTPIPVRNFGDYTILAQDADFVYATDPQHTAGFVFATEDIQARPRLGLVPVLRVALRDSGIGPYKQAHRLRIRERFALKGVATAWYLHYVRHFGGIVSDYEHLEGGKRLWRSFVDTARARGLSIHKVHADTGEVSEIGPDSGDSELWSTDASRRQELFLLERADARQ